MNYSDEPIHPIEPPPQRESPELARARRRRTRRQMIPVDAEGRASFVAALARRAYPSYELFLFSVLCGAVLGLGFLLDSQPVLLLGILLAPLMTPWVGLLLAILTGSLRFFFETFMALFISAVLVFLTGLLTGFASRVFQPLTFNNAFIHSYLWIPELVVLAIGAVILVASFVRSEAKPFLPSVVVAYAFFLPLNAAGFGLGSGVPGIWPLGVQVFFVHLAFASLFGLWTFFLLRIRPSVGGLVFSGVTVIVIVGTLAFLMGSGFRSANDANEISPTNVSSLPSPTDSLLLTPGSSSTLRPSPTPRIETATPSPEGMFTPATVILDVTLPATETPTITLTIEPTPVYGKISAREGGGAFLRKTPKGEWLATLDNGEIVEVLPDVQEVSGVPWAHVIALRGGARLEGWVLQSVIVYATPVPNWVPSSTPTAPRTSTPTVTATP